MTDTQVWESPRLCELRDQAKGIGEVHRRATS